MSDMPDFDSMTPEELMKWMESLAVRQGATEGLTTSADMAVAEVSADDERLAGKGDYVPYGWTEDKWKEHLAKEEEQKKAKQQSAPAASAPAPQAAPTPPPAPAPQPQAAAPTPQPAASATPDFDSMTPEELMKWMESLAVRQGATEGLITSADMAVEEVSEDDERLAGKGDYVPYGWTEDKWKEHLAKEEEQKKAKQQSAPAASAPAPAPTPQPEAEPEISFEMPDFGTPEETDTMQPVAENPMDWLSSLGAPDESLPSLDLNLDALGNLAGANETAADPMAWLSGLSSDTGDDALASLSALAGLADDSAAEAEEAEEGSLGWMETLAKRQGADDEELVTDANLNIPSPFDLQETGPGYAEFSFENATGILPESEKVGAGDVPELNLEDPEAWLDSLASGGNVIGGGDEEDELDFLDLEEEEEEPSHNFEAIAEDVKSKLDKGTASPEEIEQFFMHAFTKAGERTDVDDYIDSEEVDEADVPMPVQAEIPDWLRDSMETMEAVADEEEETVAAPRPSDTGEMMAAKLFGEDEAIPAEIPDWLSGGMGEDSGAIALDIFETPEEAATPAFALETQDTWVEAFTQEESGELAQWYESAVAGLEGGEMPVTAAAPMGAVALAVATLPDESSLQAGTPMRVPDWLSGEVSSVPSASVEVEAAIVGDMEWLTTDEAAAVDAEMPDWLRDTVDDTVTAEDPLPNWLQGEDIDIAPADIPDWLRETVDEEEEVSIIPEIVQEKPAPVPTAPAPKPVTMPTPVAASPAPVPVAAANINVAATLQDAQSKVSAGDIAGALLAYEQVVRANASLPQVEAALQKMADDKNNKGNPAIQRVLGDVLMRQGKLQQALDTYRKALNML